VPKAETPSLLNSKPINARNAINGMLVAINERSCGMS
jgi:hypothetical protein